MNTDEQALNELAALVARPVATSPAAAAPKPTPAPAPARVQLPWGKRKRKKYTYTTGERVVRQERKNLAGKLVAYMDRAHGRGWAVQMERTQRIDRDAPREWVNNTRKPSARLLKRFEEYCRSLGYIDTRSNETAAHTLIRSDIGAGLSAIDTPKGVDLGSPNISQHDLSLSGDTNKVSTSLGNSSSETQSQQGFSAPSTQGPDDERVGEESNPSTQQPVA